MQLRHTISFRPLLTQYHHHITIQLTGLIGFHDLMLITEYPRRCFNLPAIVWHCGYLHNGLTQIPLNQLHATFAHKRSVRRGNHSKIKAFCHTRAPIKLAISVDKRFIKVRLQPCSHDGVHVTVQQPGGRQFFHQKGHTTAALKGVDIGGAVGVNTCQQWHYV